VSTLDVDNDIVVSGQVTVGNVNITAASVVVRVDGSLVADGRGYAEGYGPNSEGGTLPELKAGWDGGRHGGFGGQKSTDEYLANDMPYDNPRLPTEMGASGGKRSGYLGSRGGGVIWIRAPFQTVNGNVSANGLDKKIPSSVGVGAGAGGSIYMQGDTVVGTGVVRANGGYGDLNGYTGSNCELGGGSGGRVAVVFSTAMNLSSSLIQSYGGQSSDCGGADRPGSGKKFMSGVSVLNTV
jgi:hypothetical protein